MLDVYTWPTPNGHKVHILLEETGLEYNIIAVNIGKGNQFEPDFLKNKSQQQNAGNRRSGRPRR